MIPSLNSTEAFGMVQVEAMQGSVPPIVSDLPGVRQPVKQPGMGPIVPSSDPQRLAEEIGTVSGYEQLFERLRGERRTSR